MILISCCQKFSANGLDTFGDFVAEPSTMQGKRIRVPLYRTGMDWHLNLEISRASELSKKWRSIYFQPTILLLCPQFSAHNVFFTFFIIVIPAATILN